MSMSMSDGDGWLTRARFCPLDRGGLDFGSLCQVAGLPIQQPACFSDLGGCEAHVMVMPL
jgi:hypothetical protein